MKLRKAGFTKSLVASAVLSFGLAGQTFGAEMEEVVVKGDLGSLPGENVQSVFGFNKSVLETPRSVSTISEEMMERFNMQDIDELIALAPGSFTQSFFGVAGGLDVRGTPGETYFRGVRRLDNPGNYPTPIGASDRVDIVRGPASPIYGPSKIGGYLNFNPKSARIEETGQFIPEATGAMSFTTGSWDKSIITAEVGGPGRIGDQDFGYYVYGEIEDSGSYYDNSAVEQNLFQASFDMDISDQVRIQFGGMWHEYTGNQVAGWNRVTQALIDDGIYTTGIAQSLDLDGDGRISHQEFDTDGDGFTNLNPFRFDFLSGAPGGALTPGSPETLEELEILVGDLSALQLLNPGTAQIDGNQVLVAPEDTLENEVTTLYFDIIYTSENEWEWKNQLFYERYDNLNENAYGFSQFHDTYVVENKLVISKTFAMDGMTAAVQISPSYRYTDFEHADDYTNEYFDRRDLTQASSARDKRVLATSIDDDYTEYYIGEYTNWGFALMGDFVWENGLSVLAGVRYDDIDLESRQPTDKLLFASSNNFCPPPGGCEAVEADGSEDGVSWTFSVSYETPMGLIPYITASEQSTMIVGQGAEVTVGNVLSGGSFDTSELFEVGLKGSLLDNALYFGISVYEQERTDFSAQSIVTNQSTETEGVEVEVRWVVNENLLLTFGYSNIEVTNLNTEETGYRFSFIGCDDLPNIPCDALYGGTLGGNVSAAPSGARRAGMPEDIYSITGTYDFGNGWAVNGSIIDVEEVAAGFSNSVTLPDYTLVNLGVSYETESWLFSVSGKNLTDEEYFRSNFPNLFGGVIVLPELPRHYNARIQYKF
ncbi:MAG: TonB-dependent receptor plug domain-containing protein [Pseudomonadales bacterium]|nr:TonB-dependent receptor plug domain-containing protein [Pseudomonadales bacterium]MBO7007446.1 TonB-dependent receptor plug domain-containing protein [Pseudomonadales bacterium]